MTLTVLIYGVGLFFAALAMHILLWNLCRIRKEILWLVVVFMAVPLMALVMLCVIGYLDVTLAAAIGLLHTALAVVYVQTYPALRDEIPSIQILRRVHSQTNGLSREDILDQLAGARLLEAKVEDLENDAFVTSDKGILRLTVAGTFLAVTFGLYRQLLGIKSGKG